MNTKRSINHHLLGMCRYFRPKEFESPCDRILPGSNRMVVNTRPRHPRIWLYSRTLRPPFYSKTTNWPQSSTGIKWRRIILPSLISCFIIFYLGPLLLCSYNLCYFDWKVSPHTRRLYQYHKRLWLVQQYRWLKFSNLKQGFWLTGSEQKTNHFGNGNQITKSIIGQLKTPTWGDLYSQYG